MARKPRWAALAVAAAAFAIAPGAAHAAKAPTSCNAPHPKFHHGAVKIYTFTGPAHDPAWYVCSAKIHRPRLFTDEGANVVDSKEHFRVFGGRVAYFWRWRGSQTSGWELGWVDTRTALAPAFLTSFDNRPGSTGVDGIALNAQGAVAFVEHMTNDQQRVAWIPRQGAGLGNPKNLTNPLPNVIAARTLTFHGNDIRWKTTGGALGEVHTG